MQKTILKIKTIGTNIMISFWIKKLNQSESRIHKENVLKECLTLAVLGNSNADIFLTLVQKTYNVFVTFGVKQVEKTENLKKDNNPWGKFIELLNKLERRELTGNAAKNEINDISLQFDSEEWNNVCVPVIKKDLRSGISEKTINKIMKNTKYVIPVFSCQLASNCENRPEMKGLKRIEPKLDGVRVLMLLIPNDEGIQVSSYSRNGKLFENFKHIESQLIANLFKSPLASLENMKTGVVLDGEVVGKSFQDLMRQARRKENVQADDSVFHVFDIIPVADFVLGYWNANLAKRISILEKLRPVIHNLDNVELLPNITVDLDTAEGKDQFHRYTNDMVSLGFEGVMIKSLSAPYQCTRNMFWMKYKPVHDYDLTVVGVEEGTGKNAGKLGALVCSGFDDGKYITVNVGSGFSDIDRINFWNDSSLVIGQTAVILADAITQNQNGSYSLRFPRFKCFRVDK